MVEVEFDYTHTESGDSGTATLVWTPEDPCAVAMVFDQGDGDIVWEFSRDLLGRGTHSRRSVGEGDVKIKGCPVGKWVCVRFDTPEGSAQIHIEFPLVREFLDKIYAEVPHGTELVDVDSAITRILEGSL